MATLKIFDEADEFRIEIGGHFTGSYVNEVEAQWKKALSKIATRRLTIDISRLSGYETAGRKLLRAMHKHGATIAAPSPRSLVFLAEITAASRLGPAPEPVQLQDESKRRKPAPKTAAAGQH